MYTAQKPCRDKTANTYQLTAPDIIPQEEFTQKMSRDWKQEPRSTALPSRHTSTTAKAFLINILLGQTGLEETESSEDFHLRGAYFYLLLQLK